MEYSADLSTWVVRALQPTTSQTLSVKSLMLYYPEFGELIDQYLSASDLSGAAVARRLGLNPSTVTRWRSCHSRPRTPEMVVRVADILGVHGEARNALLQAAGFAPTESTIPLVDEMGSEPIADIPLSPSPSPQTSPQTPPSNLPNPPFRALINRKDPLNLALNALQDNQGRWIVGIDGLGGIGKTALAHGILQVCQATGLFDGFIWISAASQSAINTSSRTEGASPASGLTFEGILNAVVRELGAPELVSLSEEEKERRVLAFLREKRLLLCLDNLETAATEQATLLTRLFPLLNPSKVLCTSRIRFGDNVFPIHLMGLDAESTAQLMLQEAQERNVSALEQVTSERIAEFAAVAGGSPLTAKLAVGQARYQSFGSIVERVRTAQISTSGRNKSGTLYRQLYLPSWLLLSLEAQQLIVALSLLIPGEGGALDILAQISCLTEKDAGDAIEELWQLSLIEVADLTLEGSQEDVGKGLLYHVHPLTASFVLQDICSWQRSGDAAQTELDGVEYSAGFDYALFLQKCVVRAMGYLEEQVERYGERMPPESLRRLAARALDFGLEIEEIWSVTSRLMLKITPLMDKAGERRECLFYLEKAIAVSQKTLDQTSLAELYLLSGVLYRSLSEFDQADDRLSASLKTYTDLRDHRNQARALNRLANVKRLQKQHKIAKKLVADSLSLTFENDSIQGASYYVLGMIAFDEQQWKRAKEYLTVASDLFLLHNENGLASHAYCDLGRVHHMLQELDEAIACFEKAIAYFASVGDLLNEARYHMNLGVMQLELGKFQLAFELFTSVKSKFERFQDVPYLARLHNNLGITLRHMSNWAEAEQAFVRSIHLWSQLGDSWELTNVLNELGTLHLANNSPEQAEIILEESLRVLQAAGDHPGYRDKAIKIKENLAISLQEQSLNRNP
ncbi:MAG: tetratricopeptide repeat protein [Chloroflexota bacterium]